MKTALLAVLIAETLVYAIVWFAHLHRTRKAVPGATAAAGDLKLAPQVGVGFFANFLDTLGVGSFAITSSIYKLLSFVPDDLIPGTMNVGHALPTVAEALIFILVIAVDFKTLVAMIAAAVLGAWFGAGMVSGWSKHRIQIGLGLALLAAAMLMLGSQLNLYPVGGEALGLTGVKFWIAVGANFMFGAFMQLGVGLYAPCMILVYLLGMTPRAAFPIMMGSCAFLMPVGSYQFVRAKRYDRIAALGLTLGGIPAVLIAAYVVKSLPLGAVRWLVVCVVLYTSVMLLRSASQKALQPAPAPKTASE
ncbi:MAG TPA: sulfite exporter TauE/SafE family protein [Candidatus Acidoferrales bacterium]|nr:sulfite exporter TauE/SafE family protein [Candidatus Acidoferrales bacterium]